MNEDERALAQIGRRLDSFLRYKELNREEAALLLDHTGRTLGSVVSGGNFMSSLLFKLYEVFPELNIEWLLRGDGAMIHNQERPEIHTVIEGLSKQLAVLNKQAPKTEKQAKEKTKELYGIYEQAIDLLCQLSGELVTGQWVLLMEMEKRLK